MYFISKYVQNAGETWHFLFVDDGETLNPHDFYLSVKQTGKLHFNEW
jgi:hypothetical protein